MVNGGLKEMNRAARELVYTSSMDARLPNPTPLAEILRSLRAWPDGELSRLAREVGYELIRRKSAVPVALPVGEAMAAVSAIADNHL